MSRNNDDDAHPNLNLPPPPFSDYCRGRRRDQAFDERDYEEIYYHFDDYSQDILLANASKFMVPPEPAEHYEWEEVILDEVGQSEWEGMKKSFYLGAGCSLLSLAALRGRRSRGGLFRGLSRYSSSSSSTSSSRPGGRTGGYTFDPVPPMPNHGSHHHHQHHQHHQHATSRLGGVIDVTLATLIGMGTSLLAIENDLFYPTTNADGSDSSSPPTHSIEPPPQWISPAIPLVPGRSIVAETLCRPLTEEFRKFPKRVWRGGNSNLGIENGYDNHMALYANAGWKGTKYYRGNDNASAENLGENNGVSSPSAGVYERLVLDSLQGFVINCERRSRQERKLRKLRRVREDVPVVLPESGVEADEDLDLSDIYYEGGDDDVEEEDAGFGL